MPSPTLRRCVEEIAVFLDPAALLSAEFRRERSKTLARRRQGRVRARWPIVGSSIEQHFAPISSALASAVGEAEYPRIHRLMTQPKQCWRSARAIGGAVRGASF